MITIIDKQQKMKNKKCLNICIYVLLYILYIRTKRKIKTVLFLFRCVAPILDGFQIDGINSF